MGLRAEVLVSLIFLIGTAIAYRNLRPQIAIPVALAVGLLVGHHAYQYDLVLVLPLLMELWVAGYRWIIAPLMYPPLYELPYLLLLPVWSFIATQTVIVFCIIAAIIALLKVGIRTSRGLRLVEKEGWN